MTGKLRRLLVVLSVMFLAAGCATSDSVRSTRGEGIKRLFPYTMDVVHGAVLSAAKSRDLAVVESDGKTGQYVFSSGPSWRSFGERIAVFSRSLSPRLTEVEVVSKPVLSPLNFPRNWELALLDEIDASLTASRTPAKK
jgi:hypothetical protein